MLSALAPYGAGGKSWQYCRAAKESFTAALLFVSERFSAPLHSSGGTACTSKDNLRSPMSMRDHYLTRAAEFHARARIESDSMIRRQYETLAKGYSLLAERAGRYEIIDLIYEPPPPKLSDEQN